MSCVAFDRNVEEGGTELHTEEKRLVVILLLTRCSVEVNDFRVLN